MAASADKRAVSTGLFVLHIIDKYMYQDEMADKEILLDYVLTSSAVSSDGIPSASASLNSDRVSNK